ncbi:MAG: peptidase S10 [Anaerolineae bacterium]|jgi:carboxypeptidase C (cathepsin A)|nr:peptidase S10 [Anaerolineae bacterium]
MAEEKKETNPEEKKNVKPEVPEEKTSVTEHSIVVNGRTLEYTVTAGTMLLKAEDEKEGEKPKATVFYIAYTLKNQDDASKRPLTFSFNGGPGSSSVWMHLGMLGPKRVLLEEDGMAVAPPYELVENEYTLLDKTDLVFIDPVSTGYSRSVPGEEAKQFHSDKTDIESVGDFIHLYATRNTRWRSPMFLIGESYGTTRAAGLSSYLSEKHGLYLNGIMLISAILNFQTARFNEGNDLPFILFLPTYTATAHYHHKLPAKQQERPLEELLEEVKQFASTDYTLALMQGAALSAQERTKIVNKLHNYTGLTKDYIERTDLRINIHRFCKELRRDEFLTVGRIDSRYTGYDRDAAGEHPERDPSMGATGGAYSATLKDYVRRELGFEIDIPYNILANLYRDWKYDRWENQYVNMAEELRKTMVTNPFMKIFVANGFYDLATPYFATEYTFNHLGIPAELQENISMGYYESGHMMYVHMPSLVKIKDDLANFVDLATKK